jgi:DNA-binding SARP family transcriptional activator
MQFGVLGPFEARNGTEELPLPGGRARALLARLALEPGRTVATGRLVEDLWADPPSTATKMVQIHVAALRKALGPEVIVTRPPGYALDVPPAAVDLARFESLRLAARVALDEGDAERAAALLQDALKVWRGPALGEFAEPFARTEGARLEELRLACVEDRLEAQVAAGRHREAIAELEALAARHPLRERPRELLMRALYRSGRPADALAVYRAFRDALDAELGIAPSPGLRELELMVLRDDPALRPAPAERPSPPPAERTTADPARSPPATAAAPPERRPLSVLVARVAIDEGADPETVHDAVLAVHEALLAVCAREDAHVATLDPDGAVAWFGYPLARDDDPIRAVRAGLALLDEAGVPELRAAVDSGSVVISRRGAQAVAVGTAAQRASALVAEAPAGRLAVGRDVARHVRDRYAFEPAGGALLVGGPAVEPPADRPALVARAPELGLLRERWARAAAGEGQVVLLCGEPGIGKSRLVDELLQTAAGDGAERVVARSSPQHVASPLHPVLAALRATWPALPILTGPPAERPRMVAAIAAALFDAAARGPLLVVVEDVHWADPSTLELLGVVAEQARDARLLVCATYRPEFTPPWPVRPHVSQLALGRLGADDVAALVAAIGGAGAVAPDLRDHIADRTDGVPLFVEELTRSLLESGAARAAGGTLVLDPGADVAAIPATLEASLVARLDRLGDARALAQLAAVIGREFSEELLVAVSGQSAAAVAAALDRLVAADLLLRRGRGPGARYAFRHALVRDAAYGSLVRAARREHHARIAAVLEADFPHLRDLEPELLARHHEAAGRPGLAIPHWQRAGASALRTSAYLEAIEHHRAGLRLLDAVPAAARVDTELALQLGLGTALMGARGYGGPEVRAAFARAEKLSLQAEDPAGVAGALYGLAAFHLAVAEPARALEHAGRLHALGTAAGDDDVLLEAETLRGSARFLLGDPAAARVHIDAALERWTPERGRAHVEAFGQEPALICGSIGTLARLWTSDLDGARASEARALALADDVGHPLSVAFLLGGLGLAAMMRGDVDRTAGIAARLLELSRRHDLPLWLAWGLAEHGWVLVRRGDLEPGLAAVRDGLGALAAIGSPTTSVAFHALAAEALLDAGRTLDAAALVADGQAIAADGTERFAAADLERVAALTGLAAGGSRDDAATRLERARALAAEQGAALLEQRAAGALAGLHDRAG